MHEFQGLVSFPEPAEVRVLAPDPRVIEANTLGHSASTDWDRGRTRLRRLGGGVGLRGQGRARQDHALGAVLLPARHEKALIAWQRGSTAQIMMNWGGPAQRGRAVRVDEVGLGEPDTRDDLTEMPDLPCVGISRVEGLRLKDASLNGPVRVWLNAQADNGWNPLTMTTGEFERRAPVPADRRSHGLVVRPAGDRQRGRQRLHPGTGARVRRPRRSAAARNRDRLLDGPRDRDDDLILTLRRPGVGPPAARLRRLPADRPAGHHRLLTWHLHSTDDIQSWAMRTTRSVLGEMPVHWRRQQKNGDSSFFGVGLPCIAGEMSFTDEEIQATALATLGWWHHSLHNTIDKVEKDGWSCTCASTPSGSGNC